MLRFLVVILLLVVLSPAYSLDNGQFQNADPAIRDWFKSVKNKGGTPCCDISDGHRTEAAIKDGSYWVPIDGVWRPVPKDAVIENYGNPTGDAVVWYAQYKNDVFIRCFVPGSLS